MSKELDSPVLVDANRVLYWLDQIEDYIVDNQKYFTYESSLHLVSRIREQIILEAVEGNKHGLN